MDNYTDSLVVESSVLMLRTTENAKPENYAQSTANSNQEIISTL